MSALATSTTHPDPAFPERDLLRAVAAGTAGVVGEAFLRSLVHHVAEAFNAEIAFVAETLEPEQSRVRIVASWQRGAARLPEGLELDVAGTPCALAGEQDVILFREGACDRFPGAHMLCEHGLDGVLAIAMRGAGGVYLGHLGILSRRRVDATEDEIAALSIFAARAGAEIERRRHELALRDRDAEVAASRARMVQAADDERRRIGRDMHDGAQQRLLALGHLAGLALRRLPAGSPEARELIEQVRREAVLAHTELRELARGLHPAGLTERGLAGALEALSARSDLPLHVDAMPERRLPDPVAVTVYYLVSEALSNAAKFAGASALRVEVVQREREVVATVSDDGAGGARPEAGTGLLGLADRVAALGGTLRIDSRPGGGTTLVATIPLAPWRTAEEPFLEFGYEGDGGLGERMIAQVRSGAKTVSVSLAREWDLEGGPPRVGQRLPMCDVNGRRRGFIEVERVVELPFSAIDAEIVAREAEVAGVAEWRARHRRFYDACRHEMALLLGDPGWRLTDEEPMVALFYRFVGDAEPRTAADRA
ncbi:MAG TPA: histidine kinase [Solirubrobacteraceae bacterium]|nr:histidine kinase [Solirubrobacteraceae bacterium]